MTHKLRILGWHNVEATSFSPSPPGALSRGFERQVRFLKRHTNLIALESAVELLAQEKPLPPRAVALTFDDGYRDNVSVAADILERYEAPATFFLVPGYLSQTLNCWWERLAWAVTNTHHRQLVWKGNGYPAGPNARHTFEYIADCLKVQASAERDRAVADLVDELEPTGKFPNHFMDWDDAQVLIRRGFNVGSHTLCHSILSRESAQEQMRDLCESKRKLEERLGVPVTSLAYPNGQPGDFDSSTLGAAVAAGYRFAITTSYGINRPSTPKLNLCRNLLAPERGTAGLAVMSPSAVALVRTAKRIVQHGRADGSALDVCPGGRASPSGSALQ